MSERIDFKMTPIHAVDGVHIFQSPDNLVQDDLGLHMWCRNGAGAGFMITRPATLGTWKVRSRISAGLNSPSTKVCLLLWPDGGQWPPEIDFNESGDRTYSHQTVHYTEKPRMFHSAYPMTQTRWHTWGVTLTETDITYTCDGLRMGGVDVGWGGYTDLIGTVRWNLHVRTEVHGSNDITHQDVRWVELP